MATHPTDTARNEGKADTVLPIAARIIDDEINGSSHLVALVQSTHPHVYNSDGTVCGTNAEGARVISA